MKALCLTVALVLSCLATPMSYSAGPSCSLTPEQLRAQRKKLLPGLFKRAEKMEDLSEGTDGIRLRLKQRPGLLAELARIIEREQDCCSFLSFHLSVEASGGPITFDITGPEGTRQMLKSL